MRRGVCAASAGRVRQLASAAAHIAELDEPELTERVDDRQRCVVLHDQLDQLHLLLDHKGHQRGGCGGARGS